MFYKDEVLRGEVAEMFGCARQLENHRQIGGGVWQRGQRLPYVAGDDDLVAWRLHAESRVEGELVEVMASVGGVEPPWNFRFDLELCTRQRAFL